MSESETSVPTGHAVDRGVDQQVASEGEAPVPKRRKNKAL